MNKTLLCRIGLLSGLLLSELAWSFAAAAPVAADHVEVELVAQNRALVAGDNRLALRIKPEKGWHVYWRNPGDSGLPTKLVWPSLPDGLSAGEIQWPFPEEHTLGDLTNYGYGEDTLLPFSLSVAAGSPSPVALKARAEWLVCADVCIPGKAEVTLDLPVAEQAQADPKWQAAFDRTIAHLPKPAEFQSRFQIDAEEFRLAFDALPGSSEQARFYPYATDLVAHTAQVRNAWSGRSLSLARPLSSYFVQAPESVQGILVLGDGEAASAYEFTAGPGTVAPVAASAETPAGTSGSASAPGFWFALGFAFIGGLILNLMPCVFPVLSLKALSVMKVQGEAAAEHRRHALSYTAGVVASFLLVAGVLIGLRAGGAALGWGFQLQSPLFVGLLVYVMVALGLSLSGLVQFGTRWMGAGQNLATKPGLSGSFFTGVLAVVVASPCTAPFMGSALGFALTQPAIASLTVFVALALGLAFPFLLLGFVPALAAWLPRPGAWMETLKQLLAFPLYLTAVWLLWVLGGLTDRSGMALALVGLVTLAFGLWLIGQSQKRLAHLVGLIAVIGAVAVLFHPMVRTPSASTKSEPAIGWEPYSDARLAELRAQGKTVFVDFTADWCLTCKVNERIALHSAKAVEAFEKNEVVALVADWTRADPEITAALARYERSGVPLYLVSVKGAEPRVLPQVLTPDLVADAVSGR